LVEFHNSYSVYCLTLAFKEIWSRMLLTIWSISELLE
jgi:hypothetical protein